ncbi:MAG: hypothetical protein KW788_01445 [Candidatus Doudnabacteria bacterium]|nr:hypothetical protein [Candidatus Doudnabacteria bacterium]
MSYDLTALHALANHLIYYGDLRPEYKKTSQDVLFIDWDRASGMPLVTEPITNTQVWKVLLRVGVSKSQILLLVDPAIKNIVSRLLDLPVITTNSCSAHPNRSLAYITMLFKDAAFGEKFIKTFQDFAHAQALKVDVAGHAARIFGSIGPNLSLEICLEYNLPMSFACDTADSSKTPGICIAFWKIFSQVLDVFDGKGVENIDQELLLKCVPADVHNKQLQIVHRELLERVT